MSHSTSFLSALTLIISLISLLTTFITSSHAQLVSPSDLPLGRVQIQFPSISLPGTPDQLLLDTSYMKPSLPYVLYTPSPLTTLPLNITFHSSNLTDTTGEQMFLVVRMIDSSILSVEQGMNLTAFQAIASTPGVIELRNISYSTYTNGSYYTVFSALPANNKYYFTIIHSRFQPSGWTYRLELTQDQTRITTSPVVVGEIYFRQYPTIWNLSQPAPLTDNTPFYPMFHGLTLDMTFFAGFSGPALVLPGAFTCEILLSLRRVADGKMMNNDLISKGTTSVRAYWTELSATLPGGPTPQYFNINLSLTPNAPGSSLPAYPRLPLPPSSMRYETYFVLKLVDFLSLDPENQPTVPLTVIFTPPKRVSEWKISFPSSGSTRGDGGVTREVSDNFDSLSEQQYATQQQEYHITIPSSSTTTTYTTPYLFSFPTGVHGSSGVTILTWSNSFETNFDELNYMSTVDHPYPIVSVPIPTAGDGQTKVVLFTSAGQNITWWLKRSTTVPVVVNQTQVLQSYQQQVTTLQTASKNLTSSGTTDVFIPLLQSSNSYVALQRFTSDHITTVLLPTEFVSKKIQISVTPSSSSSSSTSTNSAVRRDVYMITRTPNPVSWANLTEEVEVIPDSPAVSITLADTDGQSLTSSPLNQGNLIALTSYSYSVTQSYDTHDVPECRIYDPSSLQWIRDGVVTQLMKSTGTVQCSSSTPGTIALLRKIIIRSDVDPDTDGGRLRYGHAKNDIALVVGLLVVGGLLFLLMFIGGLVSFMRETRVMQAQINELKKAMMEGEDTRERSDSTNSEEGDATQYLPSTPMIQHDNNRSSDDQPHQQHISSSHRVSIQIRHNSSNPYSDRISSPQNFPPVIAPRKAPYPRLSDLAPEFRPLSDDELALHYGHQKENNSNNANSLELHTISEYDNDDSHSRSNLI